MLGWCGLVLVVWLVGIVVIGLVWLFGFVPFGFVCFGVGYMLCVVVSCCVWFLLFLCWFVGLVLDCVGDLCCCVLLFVFVCVVSAWFVLLWFGLGVGVGVLLRLC